MYISATTYLRFTSWMSLSYMPRYVTIEFQTAFNLQRPLTKMKSKLSTLLVKRNKEVYKLFATNNKLQSSKTGFVSYDMKLYRLDPFPVLFIFVTF